MIEVRCKAEDDAIVLEIEGDICVVTAAVVDSCLRAAMETGTGHVILDLAEVTLFGSTAANLVVEAARRCAGVGVVLNLRNARDLTAFVLDVAGLTPLLEPPSLRATA